MREGLNQFSKNNICHLVERSTNHPITGTKKGLTYKMNKNETIIRNKARLVAQGYSQEEEINVDETYALMAHLKLIRMLLAFACFEKFLLYQMNVNNAF